MRRKRGGERDRITEGEADTVKNMMIPRSYKENVALKSCSGRIDLSKVNKNMGSNKVLT